MTIWDWLMGREKRETGDLAVATMVPVPGDRLVVPAEPEAPTLAVEIHASGPAFWWYVIRADGGGVERDDTGDVTDGDLDSGLEFSVGEARRAGQKAAERISAIGVGRPVERWVQE